MSLLILFVLCSILSGSICAPVGFHLQPGFSQHMELANTFTKKLLSEIPTVHQSCISTQGLSLDVSVEEKSLEYLMAVLAVPQPPRIVPISETHSVEESLSRISEGLQLHLDLLQEVKEKLQCSESLSPILADIRDLSAQIHKVQQLAQISPSEPRDPPSPLSSRLAGDYEVQVAAHLILRQLRGFAQDIFRSLRHIALTHPQP